MVIGSATTTALKTSASPSAVRIEIFDWSSSKVTSVKAAKSVYT